MVAGIFLGFCANVIVKDTGRISWRLQLGSAFIPSFVLMLGIWFCPESPRWLMKNNKNAQAFKSMSRLRAHPIIAARDFYYSYVIYQVELQTSDGLNYFSRLSQCFTVPRIRRANYGASTVMIAQQMCGINSESSPFVPSSRKVRSDVLQLSRSIARPFSGMSDTHLHRRFTHLWAMVASKSCRRFPLCSLLIQKAEER